MRPLSRRRPPRAGLLGPMPPRDGIGVGAQQRLGRYLPAEGTGDPLPPDAAHLGARPFVGEQLEDGPAQLGRVVGAGIAGRVTGREARLLQVEGRHRHAHGHVLQRLVHGAELVEAVARVGADRHVGAGQHAAHLLVGDAAGELDLAAQAAVLGQLAQRVDLVAAAHDHVAHLAGQGGRHRAGGLHEQVDPVLRAHRAQVADQEAPAVLDRWIRLDREDALGVRRAAHDVHLLGRHAATLDRDAAVGLVGGDHRIGAAVGHALAPAQEPMHQAARAAALRHVHLGAQVMLVEEERRAEPAEQAADREVEVRRIAGMDHVQAPAAPGKQRQDQAGRHGDRVLGQVRHQAGGRGRQRIAEDLDPVDPLVPASRALALGTDHGDLPARRSQRLRLVPYPAVEGDRQVLDPDQGSAGLAGAAARATSRCRHTAPSQAPPARRRRRRGPPPAAGAGAAGPGPRGRASAW